MARGINYPWQTGTLWPHEGPCLPRVTELVLGVQASLCISQLWVQCLLLYILSSLVNQGEILPSQNLISSYFTSSLCRTLSELANPKQVMDWMVIYVTKHRTLGTLETPLGRRWCAL